MAFKRAVKRDAKGRVALIGPAGSGKSFTMLRLARTLAGPEGRIAAIDTEHGSLSKYAHTDHCGGAGVCPDPTHFDFDVVELASFTHTAFLDCLQEAQQGGYAVFCCDSLSHFWVGKDGALEFVDNAQKLAEQRSRSGRADGMSGWKDWRPNEREMVEAMIASPLHIIVTMRVKTAYEEQINAQGRKERVKIGLAPVQREGLEYEFDLVGAMNDENILIVDKTRCSYYAGKAITRPAAKDFQPFLDWLRGAPVVSTPTPTTPPPAPAQANASHSSASPEPPHPQAPLVPATLLHIFENLTRPGAVPAALQQQRERLVAALPETGEEEYQRILTKHGRGSGGAPLGRVKAALLDMVQVIELAARTKPKQGMYQASDADLPAGLFDGARGKEPVYAAD